MLDTRFWEFYGLAALTFPVAQLLVILSVLLQGGTLRACHVQDMLVGKAVQTQSEAVADSGKAIDAGIDPIGFPRDQRAASRFSGSFVDIGSVERQATDADERIFASGFDGVCDR